MIKEKRNGNCKEGYGQESGEEKGPREEGRKEKGPREKSGKEKGPCKEEETGCEESSQESGKEARCKESSEKAGCEESSEKASCEEGSQEGGKEARCEESSEKAGCEEGSGGSGPGCDRDSDENVTQPTSCLAVPDRRKTLIGTRSVKTATRLRPGFLFPAIQAFLAGHGPVAPPLYNRRARLPRVQALRLPRP